MECPLGRKHCRKDVSDWAGVICRLRFSGLRLQVSGLRLQVSRSAGKFILRGKTSTIAHAQCPNRERAKNCESIGKRVKTSGLSETGM